MIRKTALAIAAVAALGAASLIATPAVAKGGKGGGFHGHHSHHGHVLRGGIGLGLVAYASCYRNVWVINRFGETVLRRVYVCG